jgi:hypothetical protein
MGENAGFCAAHNRGIRETAGEFVFLANPDLVVAEDHLDVLVQLFARRPRAACANGKLIRYDAERGRETNVIDSAGLAIGRNRRAVDRGEGLVERPGLYDGEEEVFAVSGAAFFARRAALEEAAADGEVLDESFFMYKEDVDLSWRLRALGWECWYVPSARAHHARSSRGLGAKSYASAIREFHRSQLAKPAPSRVHSLRNQWLLLVKNEDLSSFARDFLPIVAREAAVVGWTILFSPRSLVAVGEFAARLPGALAKRRWIRARRVVPAADLRLWLGRR